ncbi:hypothetical protein N9N24_03130 [Candidatus Marinimicrobia bacterium]|nr:hypothetical protein [Candidatus Neomarinimicrobiota bacterium]
MSINILKRFLLVISLIVSGLSAQDKVDAIEAARQAKAAAEKAAADAEAATDAAIEQAAKNAAKGAREKIKQDRLDEEARKLAEAKAAEEAELDAAAAAAAEEAKRKMAEELGLEYTPPVGGADVVTEEAVTESTTTTPEEVAEEVLAKEALGWSVGGTGSIGFLNGAYITNTPVGGSIVAQTPYGFNLGEKFNFKVSLAGGIYQSEAEFEGLTEDLDALFVGLGVNATLFELVFSETHVGLIGAGLGLRNFSGVSLEKIMKKSLDLPVNILVGAESFIATKADERSGNSTYWAGLGLRLNYSF